MSENKPNSEAAGWRRLLTDYPFHGHIFRLRRDRVQIGGIHEFEFTYLESKGAVWVVPVVNGDKIALIRQYRYAVDEWVWEVPAGGMFDHDGSLESLASRELAEEIGGEAERLQYLGWFYGGTAITDVKCHIFIGHNTRVIHEPRREISETIEVHLVPLEEAFRMARSGEMRDGRSALALLWSEPHLTER